MCLKKSSEYYGRLRRIRERLEKLEGQASQQEAARAEESYYLAFLCDREVRLWKEEQKKREPEVKAEPKAEPKEET